MRQFLVQGSIGHDHDLSAQSLFDNGLQIFRSAGYHVVFKQHLGIGRAIVHDIAFHKASVAPSAREFLLLEDGWIIDIEIGCAWIHADPQHVALFFRAIPFPLEKPAITATGEKIASLLISDLTLRRTLPPDHGVGGSLLLDLSCLHHLLCPF